MSDKQPGKQTVSVQMPAELVEALDRYGEAIERPRSWVMREAVSAYLAREDEKNRATRRALADIDAGRVVDQDVARRWAASLDSDTPRPLPVPGA